METSFYGVEIVGRTPKDQSAYGHAYGSSTLVITQEQLKALQAGDGIACNDGEYSTFVYLESYQKEQ